MKEYQEVVHQDRRQRSVTYELHTSLHMLNESYCFKYQQFCCQELIEGEVQDLKYWTLIYK